MNKKLDVVLVVISLILGLIVGPKYRISSIFKEMTNELFLGTIITVVIFVVIFWISMSLSKKYVDDEIVTTLLFFACVFIGGIIVSIGYAVYPIGGLSFVFTVAFFVVFGASLGYLVGLIILMIFSGMIKKYFLEAS